MKMLIMAVVLSLITVGQACVGQSYRAYTPTASLVNEVKKVMANQPSSLKVLPAVRKELKRLLRAGYTRVLFGSPQGVPSIYLAKGGQKVDFSKFIQPVLVFQKKGGAIWIIQISPPVRNPFAAAPPTR
jgi:hypothetical protein